MAKDFKLDDYGDFDISTGDFEFVTEDDELIQIMETKTLKVYGEDAYDQEGGVNWFYDGQDSPEVAMYDFSRDDELKLLSLKAKWSAIPEITSITKVELISPDRDGVFQVHGEFNSIYSDVPLKVNA